MADIKTDDLPVDETLGEGEMREVKGGNEQRVDWGALPAQPSYPAQQALLERQSLHVQQSLSNQQSLSEQQAVLADHMKRFQQTSQLLTGVMNSWHGTVKKIMGKMG